MVVVGGEKMYDNMQLLPIIKYNFSSGRRGCHRHVQCFTTICMLSSSSSLCGSSSSSSSGSSCNVAYSVIVVYIVINLCIHTSELCLHARNDFDFQFDLKKI